MLRYRLVLGYIKLQIHHKTASHFTSISSYGILRSVSQKYMTTKKKKVTKSYGKTHKKSPQHPKHFLKVYWPYIPILLLVLFGVFFTGVNPTVRQGGPATLAYATEMSVSGLLSATNAQRASNGLPALTLNSKLNSSAQAKANDMVSKDYWSHNSPNGDEPWVFFDAAGYNYQKAGENLAYGFSNSDATVVGWMNSPSHRANILDTSYQEVGFGFTNAENFVATGQETVVVAHYAKPTVVATAPVTAPATAPAAAAQPAPQSLQASETRKPAAQPAPAETPVEVPVEAPIVVEDTVVSEAPAEELKNAPVTSATPVPVNPQSTNITRLQRWTGGNAPWSALAVTVVAFVVVTVWLVKHMILVKRFVHQGEYFVAHHPVLDLLVVSIAALAIYLSQTSGVVI
jgi:uncharacterized protein YkwD